MWRITGIIESYGAGEILLALVAGVGTFLGGEQFILAFTAGVLVTGLARKLDTYGVRARD
jgi:hypothetical protein